MVNFRPFRNTDPPALVAVWRGQPPQRGLMQPMTVPIFEHLVLSKPYFDRNGLIVAEQDGQIVGFVHAAFGPSDDRSNIGKETGVVCLLQTHPDHDSVDLRNALLAKAEEYLQHDGANMILGGGIPVHCPFYLGLYGGSELPGVLCSDLAMTQTLEAAGYEQAASFEIMNRQLNGFRPPVDRVQRQLSRQFSVTAELDHQFDTWWDACTLGATQHSCFRINSNRGENVGSVIFWDLEPLASSWGVPAVGLSHLRIRNELRKQGLGTFLISQALKHLDGMSTALAQVQVPSGSTPANELFRKLGFEVVDRGVSFAKKVAT